MHTPNAVAVSGNDQRRSTACLGSVRHQLGSILPSLTHQSNPATNPQNNVACANPAGLTHGDQTGNGTPQTCNRSELPSRRINSGSANSLEEKLNVMAAAADVNSDVDVPSLPPIEETWACACGKGPWPMTRRRCSCIKWLPGCRKGMGGRGGRQKKKQNEVNPPANQSPASICPASVVNMTQSGVQKSNFSPMTANTEEEDDDATTSTATSADTTGTTLMELLRKDVGQCGDGGDSDEGR